MNSTTWSTDSANHIDGIKKILSNLSLVVRGEQLKIMLNLFKPSSKIPVLDLGLSPSEELVDTNYFEKYYPFPKQIVGVSVEDCSKLKKKYGLKKVVKVTAGKKLPFATKQFNLATAWATLEHVGTYAQQEFFLNELLRVGKHIFVTTPYRFCIYEPHTGFFFVHWLPLWIFRWLCQIMGRKFWVNVQALNPLSMGDIKKMNLIRPVHTKIYKTLDWLPSHLIITDVSN